MGWRVDCLIWTETPARDGHGVLSHTTKIAVYNRYVTRLGLAGGPGRAKAAKPKGPPPGSSPTL
eukprot:4319427-Prymnesium_polylepis.1